jgi:hypothetical protein
MMKTDIRFEDIVKAMQNLEVLNDDTIREFLGVEKENVEVANESE